MEKCDHRKINAQGGDSPTTQILAPPKTKSDNVDQKKKQELRLADYLYYGIIFIGLVALCICCVCGLALDNSLDEELEKGARGSRYHNYDSSGSASRLA